MFICDSCFKSSKPNELCHRKVVETRVRNYEHSVTKGGDGEKEKYVKVYKSKGWEIVREQRICQSCIGREIDKELLAMGKDVVNQFESKGTLVIPKPKRKSKEEESQFSIKLPYDVLPSNFFRDLDGLKELLRK